jgi:hypothetical protein
MTDERQMAVTYLAAAVAVALFSSSTIALALVAAALVALLVGYRRRMPTSAAAAGLLLYYPLALALGRLAPGGWEYVGSAVVLIPLSERLSFEYRMSSSLKGPLGVDEESRALAAGLSRSHGARLLWYTGGAAAVTGLALAASTYARYWIVLVAGSIILLFALWAYGRR